MLWLLARRLSLCARLKSKVEDTKISKVWKDLGLSKFNDVAKATQRNLVNSRGLQDRRASAKNAEIKGCDWVAHILFSM